MLTANGSSNAGMSLAAQITDALADLGSVDPDEDVSDDPVAEVRQLRSLVMLMNNRIAELEQAGASQSKRAKVEPAPAAIGVPKAAPSSTAAAAPTGDIQRNFEGFPYFELANLRHCAVKTFKKSVFVDVREVYAEAGSGKLMPGKRGLCMNENDWVALKTAGPELLQKIDNNESFDAPLTGMKRAAVTTFQGKLFVDLREMYTDDSGAQKPGKKGLMLKVDEFRRLMDHAGWIDTELANQKK